MYSARLPAPVTHTAFRRLIASVTRTPRIPRGRPPSVTCTLRIPGGGPPRSRAPRPWARHGHAEPLAAPFWPGRALREPLAREPAVRRAHPARTTLAQPVARAPGSALGRVASGGAVLDERPVGFLGDGVPRPPLPSVAFPRRRPRGHTQIGIPIATISAHTARVRPPGWIPAFHSGVRPPPGLQPAVAIGRFKACRCLLWMTRCCLTVPSLIRCSHAVSFSSHGHPRTLAVSSSSLTLASSDKLSDKFPTLITFGVPGKISILISPGVLSSSGTRSSQVSRGL